MLKIKTKYLRYPQKKSAVIYNITNTEFYKKKIIPYGYKYEIVFSVFYFYFFLE